MVCLTYSLVAVSNIGEITVPYAVVLKSLKVEGERIVLSNDSVSLTHAEQRRKNWRRVLGGKNWIVDRRPGLDTLDHLALKIERVQS